MGLVVVAPLRLLTGGRPPLHSVAPRRLVAPVDSALLEPTKLEAQARQTPFGKGPEAQKFKALSDQEKTLYEALRISAQPAINEAQAA